MGGGGFLYTDLKSDKKRLIIGRGDNRTSISAEAVYKTKEDTRVLTEATWMKVRGFGSRTGLSTGHQNPKVKVIPVPDAVNKSILENLTFYEEETSLPGIGIICLTPEDFQETFIPFNDTAAGWCDLTWNCRFGGLINIVISSSLVNQFQSKCFRGRVKLQQPCQGRLLPTDLQRSCYDGRRVRCPLDHDDR